MAKGMDRRTDKEKRKGLLELRRVGQESALALINNLHDEGFTGIWMDSTQISGDGGYYIKVYIDSDEIGSPRMEVLLAIAANHNAKVALDDIYMNGQRFSRIALWPKHKED